MLGETDKQMTQKNRRTHSTDTWRMVYCHGVCVYGYSCAPWCVRCCARVGVAEAVWHHPCKWSQTCICAILCSLWWPGGQKRTEERRRVTVVINEHEETECVEGMRSVGGSLCLVGVHIKMWFIDMSFWKRVLTSKVLRIRRRMCVQRMCASGREDTVHAQDNDGLCTSFRRIGEEEESTKKETLKVKNERGKFKVIKWKNEEKAEEVTYYYQIDSKNCMK